MSQGIQEAAVRRTRLKWGQHAFELGVLLTAFILFVLPFVNLFATSVSSSRAILSGEVFFRPVELQLDAWRETLKNKDLMSSFSFTVMLTLIYTVLSSLLIMLAAYPLSRKDLKGRGKFIVFFMFTMYFSGGLIPMYLLLQTVNLLDNFWVLVLPGAFSVFNMLILKSFYQNIPDSLEESARIDGANDFQILFLIYFPLSLPAMATLALFFAVGRWNSFSDAIFYLPTRRDLNPLQLTLQRMLQVVADAEAMEQKLDGTTRVVKVLSESQKAANILFTVIPIVLVYPWLQRFFVKGVLIGSVKG